METPGKGGDPWGGMGTLGRVGDLERDGDAGEGWEPSKGEGWGAWGGMGSTGRDKDCREGWGTQGGFGTSERSPRKDRDFCEGCGPCGEMGTHKEWGGQKGRRCWGGTETPGNDGNPKEGRAIPAPVPHRAGSFLCHLRPVLPIPRLCHYKLGTAQGQNLGSITPPAAPFFFFPPQSLSPQGPGEQPGGSRGHTRRDTAV